MGTIRIGCIRFIAIGVICTMGICDVIGLGFLQHAPTIRRMRRTEDFIVRTLMLTDSLLTLSTA